MAAREPAPGGGAVAAVTVGAAAALVAMAARFSDDLATSAAVVERCDALRAEAVELAAADGRAYAAVLAAYADHGDGPDERRSRIREALSTASDVPVTIVERAHEVGNLAARLAAAGNANLTGDAVTAAMLAEAAARSAAHLVRLNVSLGDLGDERTDRTRALCAELRKAVESAAGEQP